jgi:tetratricopeptide (TPR) repeat protein
VEVAAQAEARGFQKVPLKSGSQLPILHLVSICAAAIVCLLVLPVEGQTGAGRAMTSANAGQAGSPVRGSGQSYQPDGEDELQKGTALTRQGAFAEAIPHLQAARGHVANEYAADFNLALCYFGTEQFESAIDLLNRLRSDKHDGADVENLLAQAYIGNGQPQPAFASFERAAAFSPRDEKLYAFVADACMDHQQYRLGLQIVDIGLKNLPQSARLRYERAVFFAQLDEPDQARQEFELAARLDPESQIGVLASAHESLLTGDIARAIRTARAGVKKGFEGHALLTLLGEALIRSGASPGQPDFVEAETVLEKAVAEQPTDATSQIALGSLYLLAGRLDDSISHLLAARRADPNDPSIYANLAKAYQRRGDKQQAQDALSALEKLNQAQAKRINSASGDRRLGYAGQGVGIDEEEAVPKGP